MLRAEVAELMQSLSKDIDAVVARNRGLLPHLLQAHRLMWAEDIGLNRYVSGGTDE